VGSTCFKREKGKRKAVFSLKKKTPISEGKRKLLFFFAKGKRHLLLTKIVGASKKDCEDKTKPAMLGSPSDG